MENTTEEILNELNNFSGTENYYKASFLYDLNLTDGIKFLCEKASCYWLIDIIGSVQHKPLIRKNSDFIIWEIKRDGKGFIVKAYSDYNKEDEQFNKANTLYVQKGEYTDFPLNDFQFYQNGKVLLLKGEY